MQVSEPDISSTKFREVLGRYCSGLTVVTAIDDDQPVGFTCQSFHALSLNPPMVTFAAAKTSGTWAKIRRVGRFAVNVLSEEQGGLCRQFGKPGADKFAGVSWRPGRTGSPVLAGSVAWIDCEIDKEVDGGDHVIVLGRVLDLAANDEESRPLLFFCGQFGALAKSGC